MNPNTRKMIQEDLVGLDQEIDRSRRMATFHQGDDEPLAQDYADDASDLQAIRDAVAAGELPKASSLVRRLDAYARDEIPNRLLNTIHAANPDSRKDNQ